MRSSRRRAGEGGMILIAVLLAVAIMSVMVVATAALTRAGIGNEELEQRRLASSLALRSAIESAKAMILATPEDKRLFLDGSEVPVDLGNGVSATVTLRDAAGLADLNRSDPKLIESVALMSGLGEEQAEGLAERITKLRKEAAPATAGEAPQAKATPPAGLPRGAAAAQPGAEKARQPPTPIIFVDVDQLPDLLDIPPEDASALNTGLTVYNPTGEVNPFAAPEQVLQAIPGLTDGDISDIAMAKKSQAGTTDGRLQQIAQRLPGMLTFRNPTVFMVGVTLSAGRDVLPGSAARAVVRLMPQGQMPFGTLALQEQ